MRKLFLFSVCSLTTVQIAYPQNIGVNTISPTWPLHVMQAPGISLENNQPVLLSEYTGSNPANVIAVKGYSKPTALKGYGGWFEGGLFGAFGTSQYIGVHGHADIPGTGFGYGVAGTASGLGHQWAIDGQASGSGQCVGASGWASGDSLNYGVTGLATGGLFNYGIYGYASGGSLNWAGYFEGDVKVTGEFEPQGGILDISGGAGTAGQILSSTGAGTQWINPSMLADNLGNHVATQNLVLGAYALSGDGDGEGVYVTGSGRVGVNINDPLAPLQVRQPPGTTLNNEDALFYAHYSGNNPADIKAVEGSCSPADGFGIGGLFWGGKTGVQGNVYPSGSAQYRGVTGLVSGGSGTNYAVRGDALGGGTNYGVYGSANGGTANWAGYFNGDAKVTGGLSLDGSLRDGGGDPGSAGQILSTTGTLTDWIDPSTLADNMGNHTATQNIVLGTHAVSGDGGNEGLYVSNTGMVGINQSASARPLHVKQPSGTSLASGEMVIYGEYTGTNLADVIGIKGFAKPQDYYGIGGVFEGGWKGLESSVNATGSSTYTGVDAHIDGGGGGMRYALSGNATGTSGTKYGIYATASGGGTNWAGYFSGNVNVTGTLSKGGGSFKIDHPLDPENKYLYHSFVESPDMMNVYNGNVVLDAAGEAMVALPEWFDALNRDFRYQLTPVGAPGPNLYISEEIRDNRFRIAGGAPGSKVSWQVTGIRQDPFANANRIPVEADKKPEDRGTYLHPGAYGQPDGRAEDAKHRQKRGQ